MALITQYDLIADEDRLLTDEFINSLRVQVKKATVNSYKISLGLFYLCLDDQEINRASKTKRKHIVYWLNELRARGYAPSTALTHVFQIRLYLSWLYERKSSRKNPWDLILRSDLPRLPKKLPRPLPSEVDRSLIEYLDYSNNFYDKCLLLLRHTGLRLSDLLQLETNTHFVDDNGHSFIRIISPKFDKEYSLPIDEKVIKLITFFKKQNENIGQNITSNRLVNDPKGKSLDSVLRNHLKVISPLVSDIPITPHQLRHTYATSMVNAGMGLYSVMKLLGHMDMRMTLRYAELYPTTLHREYQSALESIKKRYEIPPPSSSDENFNPIQALDDINHWLRNTIHTNNKKLLPIIKRLSRFKTDISKLINKNDEIC